MCVDERRVLAFPSSSTDGDSDVDTQSIGNNLNLCQMGGDKDAELEVTVQQTTQPTPVHGGMARGNGGYTLMKEDSLAPESRRLIREVARLRKFMNKLRQTDRHTHTCKERKRVRHIRTGKYADDTCSA